MFNTVRLDAASPEVLSMELFALILITTKFVGTNVWEN